MVSKIQGALARRQSQSNHSPVMSSSSWLPMTTSLSLCCGFCLSLWMWREFFVTGRWSIGSPSRTGSCCVHITNFVWHICLLQWIMQWAIICKTCLTLISTNPPITCMTLTSRKWTRQKLPQLHHYKITAYLLPVEDSSARRWPW